MINPLGFGMLGGGQKSLAPSTQALGPNVYFGNRIFLTALGIALALHVIVLVIVGLTRPQQVTDIPVRALSFKIGDSDRIAAYSNAPAAPAMTADAGSWRAAPLMPPKHPLRQKPVEVTPPVLEPLPIINRTVVTPPQPAQPVEQSVQAQPDTPQAIAPTPQHYIREVGAAPGIPQGVTSGQGVVNQSDAATEAMRQRYEQQISSWIELHKLYPAAAQGVEGRTVMRMRIDRQGYIRYYAIETSSGNAALDNAAIDMIRRANPVPAVPGNYPSGALIEFLIPITFKVPQ